MKLTEAQKEIVEKNTGLVHHILKKYNFAQVGSQDYDDYFQQGAFGLCLAAQRFDESKGIAFNTFACSYISGYIFRHYREFAQGPVRPMRRQLDSKERLQYIYYNKIIDDGKGGKTETLEQLQFESPDGYFDNDVILKIDFQSAISNLGERDKKIAELLYMGIGQNEAGRRTGISQAQVSRIKNRIKPKIKAVI